MTENRYGAPGNIEGRFLNVANGFPFSSTTTKWITAFFRPEAVFKIEAENATALGAAKNFVAYGLLTGAAIGVAGFTISALSGDMSGALSALTSVVLFPVSVFVVGFILSAILFAFAKIVGGKGKFSQQTYVLSLLIGGSALLQLPFQVLALLPLIGIIFNIPILLISVYSMYSQYKLIKEAHQLSSLKAAFVVVAPLIIFAILVILLFFFFLSVLLMSLGSVISARP
ncbi:MAG: YIP1 family protein [Candidatus Micrarchaeota archaeon]|nr:YIP1 family protein [Candidatus Micrarchaeota archaeon]